MTLASVRPPLRAAALLRRFGRTAMVALGWMLIVVGAVGSVLPWHLGLPILAAGLVIVLRSSFQARRQFISLQHRHPRIVFPIRRLLRRDPEVLAVAWQQILRIERLILPRRWRPARRLRRRLFRRAVVRSRSCRPAGAAPDGQPGAMESESGRPGPADRRRSLLARADTSRPQHLNGEQS